MGLTTIVSKKENTLLLQDRLKIDSVPVHDLYSNQHTFRLLTISLSSVQNASDKKQFHSIRKRNNSQKVDMQNCSRLCSQDVRNSVRVGDECIVENIYIIF